MRVTLRGWFALFFTVILTVCLVQPGAATAATAGGGRLGSPVAAQSGPAAAAPQTSMTLAQRRTQVQAQLGGLSPVQAAARDHAVTKQASPVAHPKAKATPARPWNKPSNAAAGTSLVQPMVVPPDPDSVTTNSFVDPGEIDLGVYTHIPSGTTASGLEGFELAIFDSTGTPVYSQVIPRSVPPTTYNGQASGGYCYAWSVPSSPQADWCWWGMWNVPGGILQDGHQYFALVAFESTTGDWSPNGTYSGLQTVFYTPDIPGAEAGICTCYAQNSQGDPVDTATGTFYQSVTDAKLVGAGTPFSLTRSYRSDRTASGLLGTGWSLPFDAKITTATGTATLTDSDGSQITFTQNGNGTYTAPAGVRLTLVKTSTGWTVTALDHSSRTFNSSGQLTAILDASGHGLTLAYASGHPSTVTDTAGRVVTLTVNSSGQLTKVALPDGRSVAYGYTSGHLTSVTDLRGGTTSYTYDTSGHLLTVTDALRHVVTTNTYDATTGRITSQVDGTGAKTTFAWTAATQESDMTDANGGVRTDIYAGNVLTQSIDPFGNSVSYTYDQSLHQIGITDRLGNTTTMTYDAAGDMLTRVSPAPLSYTESWTYDSAGDVTSHTDGDSHKTTYAYDSLGRLTSTTDPNGGVAKQTYTSLGELLTTTTPRGEVTTYGYDAAGNRTSVTTAAGEKTTFTYDGSGRVLTKTDPRGNVSGATAAAYTTTYIYDNGDLLTSSKDPAGNTTGYGHDADGQLTTVTDPLNKTTTTAYDADGRATGVTDPAGKATTKAYDPNGNLLSVTDPLGDKTSYTYDKANRRVTTVSARGNVSGGTASAYTTTYGYDANGNQTTVTDPTGAVTATAHDVINRPVKVTDPLSHATTTTYDAVGNVTKTTDPLGNATSATYDALGHKLTGTDPLSHTTTYTYDADGNRISQATALGEKTTWTYDQDERTATSVDPRGNVSGVTPATYTTTYGYDAAGNRISVTDPLGDKTTAVFDGDNRQTSSADALGDTTGYAYDADSRLTGVTAPDGGVTAYAYDTVGNLTTRTDANSHVTTYAYDAVHRLTSVTDPLGHAVGYSYDAEGNATVVTDARSQTTTRTYDARNLVTKVAYSDGTPTVTYTYDKTGQVASIVDATGTRALTYNNDGVLTAIGGFAYTHDGAGNITSRTYPDGEKTTYTYNQDNEQTAQTADGATVNYAYDVAGNLATTTLPSANGFTEGRTYDAAGRLTSVGEVKGTPPTETVLDNWQLTLDADGRPTIVTNAIPVSVPSQGSALTKYTYDTDGRVASSCTGNSRTVGGCLSTAVTTYTYDKVGNRLTQQAPSATTTYTYNAADELTQAATPSTTTAYTYDADGNQTAAGSNAFAYNAANQLTGATIAGTAYTFTNDADGNRVTTATGGTTTQTETWDVNNPLPQLATLSGAGSALIGDYHYDPLGEVQSEKTAAGAYYDGHDGLGSVTNLTDSTGAVQVSDSYDPFGVQTATAVTSSAPVQPFGYTGALEDQVVPGQVDLRARSYDPTTGRFTSRDPITPKTSDPYIAAYVYADDAPSYLTDPSGKSVGSWLGDQWDQFSSGFVQGAEAPFKLVGGLYDAFTGQNGGWSGFFDTYVPVRPAYRLFNIADILRQEGCPQLADLYENAGNQLASQIAALGIGGLTGWERAAAATDSAEASAGVAGAGGGWATIGESPGGAVGQTLGMSCVAACAEMVSEGELLQADLLQTKPVPWNLPDLAAELKKSQPDAGWHFSSPDPGVPELLAQIRRQSIGVANLASGMPHAVVVGGLDAAGNIIIRDPWNGGSTYTMTPQEFENHFLGQMVWKP